MKLTVVLLLAACLQGSAKGYSQKVTLKENNISLQKIFEEIRKQTGYQFLYADEVLSTAQKASINIKRGSIEEILNFCFKDQQLSYIISGNTIIVKRGKIVFRPGALPLTLSSFPSTFIKKSEQLINANEIREKLVNNAIQIKGKVVNSSGNALIGVSVTIKGTNIGTSTDSEGIYSLTASDGGATLVFSYVGFITKEVPINGRSRVDVTLEENVSALDQIVVVGYGTQKKKDLTGAISVVDVSSMIQQPVGQVASQLQGQASGVTILGGGQPGEAPQIRIRGINTFGNNTPLFVVDGVPSTDINDLNSSDIASMQVLKDASASIYGSRAANGVVIITTKTGSGKVKVQYDAYYGVQTVKKGNVWDLNSSQEMADLKWLVYKNSNPNSPINDPLYGSGDKPVLPDYIAPAGLFEGDSRVDPSLYHVNPFYTDPAELQSFYRITKANKTGTDWFHEIFSNAPTMNHNIAFSGGNDNAKYLFSLNYLNQEGTLNETYLKRYTIRANSEFNITKHIKVGENLAYSLLDNKKFTVLSEGSPIGFARRMEPIIPVYDIMGNFAGGYGGMLGVARNPVAEQVRSKNNDDLANRLFGNVFAQVDIGNNLTLHTIFGGSISNGNSNRFDYPTYEGSENITSNGYGANSYFGANWTWTNTIQFKKIFNDVHNLTLIAGTESYKNSGGSINGYTNKYFSFDPNYTNLSTGSGTQTHSSAKYGDALFSYIGRLDYSFNNKYLLGATIRRDGSSRFLNKQFGWFPSVSAAWRISQENFMQTEGLRWINDLKIRAAYGVMGNQINVDPANGFTTYGSNRTLSSYSITGSSNSLTEGFQKTRIGNPDAKWETNSNSNIGLDATLFNGKLNLTVDYYHKEIKDMLYNPSLPATAGQATRPFVNIAQMENKGIDLSASSFLFLTKDLKLDASLSFTSYHNEILNISNSANYFELDARRFNGSNIVRNEVGHSVGQFYGYKIAGFWNSQEEIDQANESVKDPGNPNAAYQNDVAVGRFRYADTDGDGRITPADRTFLGNPNPDFSYGLNFGLKYKNFDFGIFLYGVYGNDIWNNVLWWTDFYSNFEAAKSHTALYNSWTPTNHNAIAPIQELTGSFSTGNVPNSYYVKKGSYLRAKNAQIGYTFPSEVLKSVKINKLRVYIQAANLFTITGYKGLDPEVSGSTTDFGVDEGTYPSQRQFLIGVNLTF